LAHISSSVQQAGSEAVQAIKDYLAAPRIPGCVGTATAAGADSGAESGTLIGAFGGPADEVTVPAGAGGGYLIGGAAGWLGGMSACMTGSGGGGSGSGGGNSGGGKQGKFWKSLKRFRGNIKTNGESGTAKRFYQWDYTHGDVEVYNSRGLHLGTADPETGDLTKPAVPVRRLIL
jgi:Cytotoxic